VTECIWSQRAAVAVNITKNLPNKYQSLVHEYCVKRMT
jgi:hypothetical protein